MTTYPDEIMIGSDTDGVGGMDAVSSLGGDIYYTPDIAEGAFTVDPASYSQTVRTGDGSEIEQGWLQTTWHINGLHRGQYDALKAYRTGLSTPVYIRTLDPDGNDYKNYSALMIWPIKPNVGEPTAVEGAFVFDFELRFIKLIEQS